VPAVVVQDTGTGFAPDEAKKLFNAFFTTKPEGMGIGLSLCRTIVEAHGGRISATANDGPGATFRFTLPAASAPSAG
jgi:signal transduction histidine kinase